MPAPSRDTAVAEVLMTRWSTSGLTDLIPNGVFWSEAPKDTPMPYCLFDFVANVPDGQSNKSEYRRSACQFRVYDLAADLAMDKVCEVANRMQDSYLLLAPGDGRVQSVDRGDIRHFREDDGVHSALVEITVRRTVRRTGAHQGP